MIQRIQTLYLLLATICVGLLFFFPFGHIVTESLENIPLSIKGFEYLYKGEKQFFDVLPLTIMISISVAVSIISIFMYKKRMLQIRFNIFNLIIQLGSVGLMVFYLFQASKVLEASWTSSITIIMPLVAFIFTYLAIRSIGKDEALVRSISRMR